MSEESGDGSKAFKIAAFFIYTVPMTVDVAARKVSEGVRQLRGVISHGLAMAGETGLKASFYASSSKEEKAAINYNREEGETLQSPTDIRLSRADKEAPTVRPPAKPSL